MALKEKLLESVRVFNRVPIEVNGLQLYARDITGAERIEYERFVFSQLTDEGKITSATALEAKLIQLATVDEDDAIVFGKDYEAITKLPSGVISRLYEAAAKVCGLYKEPDTEQAEATLDVPTTDPQLAGLSGKNL